MTLQERIQSFLIDEGLVRDPYVVGPNYPLWIEPEGIPAPGQGENATEIHDTMVLAVMRVAGLVSPRREGFIRTDGMEFWLRCTDAVLADEWEPSLRARLHDKYHWSMAGLMIEESRLYRDMQRITADAHSFTYNLQYMFEYWSQDAIP